MAYIGNSVVGVEHPSTSALNATAGTFTGNLDVDGTTSLDGLTVDGDVNLNSAAPSLTLKDTDTNRFVDLLYGTRVATIRNTMASGEDIDSVEPSIVFSFKDDGETRTAVNINHDGIVTQPLQPAFQVHKNGTEQSNIAADNSTVAVTFSTEVFDLGGNFASNTFTAPVTGKYLMALKLRFNNADTASQYYIARVITSNAEYHNIYDSDDDAGGDLEYLTLQVTQLVDMDANDTATVGVTQQGGTQQTDINGGRAYTSFSGYLVA